MLLRRFSTGLLALAAIQHLFTAGSLAVDPISGFEEILSEPFESRTPATDYPSDRTRYRLYKATGFDLPENAARKYPLIVWLHGMGERSTNNSSQIGNGITNLVSAANQAYEPAFVLAPQTDTGTGGWASETDPASLIAETRLMLTLEAMKTTYRIDPDRIYIMGLSYGGSGTWNLATHHPGYFAAAVPMSQPSTGGQLQLALLSGMPVWAWDGTNDTVTAGTVNTARSAGIRANYTQITGGGHNGTTWGGAAKDPDFYRWLMAQRRLTDPPDTTLPNVRITSPGTTRGFVTGASTLSLASLGQLTPTTMSTFTSVGWKRGATTITSSGTANSTVTNASLPAGPNLFHVTATVPHNPAYNTAFTCTFNDSIMVNDVTAPVLTVLNPTTDATYQSPTDFLTIRGYASDNQFVTRVAWSNDRGGSGIAGAEINNIVAGQVNWTIEKLPLKKGHNIITLTAYDLGGNSTSRTLDIFRSPSRGGDFFKQDFNSSSDLSSYATTSLNPPTDKFFAATGGQGTVSIVDGKFQIARSGGATTNGGALRRYATDGPPENVLAVSFDLTFPGGSPAVTSRLGQLSFGMWLGADELTDGLGNVSLNTELYINGNGANKHRFAISGSGTNSATFDSDGASRRISWFINSTAVDQIYVAPDGSTQTVGGNRSDLWVGNTQVFTDSPKNSTFVSKNLRYFKLFSGSDQVVTFQVDNLTMSDFTIPSPYGKWLSTKFSTAQLASAAASADDADLDGDGLTTLAEYALNSDPAISSAQAAPVIQTSNDHLQLTFTRVHPTDVTYIVEASDSLDAESWEPLATLDAGTATWTGSASVQETGAGATRSVTVTDAEAASSHPQRFLRLRVIYPES